MQNTKSSRHQSSETPTCKTCQHYLGLHPPNPADDNAPIAWCNPPENISFPCLPWANASKKPCYKKAN